MSSISWPSGAVHIAKYSGGWGSWYYPESQGEYAQPFSNSAPIAFHFSIALTGTDRCTAVTLEPTLRPNLGSGSYTVTAYLYETNPTTGSAAVPSGYIASKSVSGTFATSSATKTVSLQFTGFELKANTDLYIILAATSTVYYGVMVDTMNASAPGATYKRPVLRATFRPAYTLSVSPASVATGNNVSIAIGNGSGESITARIKYGSTQLWSGTTTNGSLSVAVNKSWFTTAGIATANSMQVTVTIDQDTSKSATFTVTAGSNMKPTVGALSFEPVNSGRVATNFPNDYIAGYSKVKVSAAVTAGSNASISSVVLSFPGGTNVTMAYNSTSQKYEGTTAAVINGNVTFTVTATDARGLSGNNQGALSGVVAYVPPSISPDMDHCYRCDSSGVQQNGGTYATVKAAATWYSSLSGNALTQFLFYIKEDRTAGYSDSQNLTNDQQSTPLEMHVPGENDVVTIVIAIQDKVSEVVTVEIRLPAALKNIYVRRTVDGTYLGVGMAPQRRSGKSTVELPDGGAVLIGGVPLQSVTNFSDDARDGSQFGKDFLAVNRSNPYDVKNTEVEFYRRSVETGWTNSPLGTSATLLGIRRVAILSSTRCAVTIQEFYPVAGRLWTNFYNNGTWTGWKSITPT